MKKTILLYLILMMLVLTLSLGANPKSNRRLSKTVFSEQEVIDWKWKKSAEGQLYPYLKCLVNQLQFLNETGELIAQFDYLPLSQVATSRDQNFIALLERTDNFEGSEVYSEIKKFVYRVIDFDGKEKFSIPFELPYDDPIPAIFLSNAGSAFLVDGAAGVIHSFDVNGRQTHEIDLFDDDSHDYEKPFACAISDNSKYFSVCAQKKPASFDEDLAGFVSGEPYLILFSAELEELWRVPLKYNIVSQTGISPAGKYILAAQHSPQVGGAPTLATIIFNAAGNVVLEISMLFRFYQFTVDERFLYLADKNQLFRVDLEQKNIQTIELPDKSANRIIADLQLSADGQPALIIAQPVFATNRFEFIEPEILTFDNPASAAWSTKLADEKFITPSLKINKNSIAAGFMVDYKIYKETGE